MGQTTGAMNTVNATLEASDDGSNWTDISGSSNKVEQPSQEADTGEAATLEGDYKIVTVGKFGSMELAITALYTEVPDEAFDFFQSIGVGDPIYLRWSPAGGDIGDKRYFTADANGDLAPGFLKKKSWPGADGETAGPTLLQYAVRCITLGDETISA